jgi:hypothetical protein
VLRPGFELAPSPRALLLNKQFQSLASVRRICAGQSRTGRFFSKYLGFTLSVLISLLIHSYSLLKLTSFQKLKESFNIHALLYTTTPNCPSCVPNYVTAVVTLILVACFHTSAKHNPTVLLTVINFNLPSVINENYNSNGFSNPQLRPPW